jgi:ketosteroid isomerase-like protein
MSQENVDLLRSAFDAWNAGDVEALVELADPRCEFLPLRVQLEGGAYRGHEGIRQFLRDMADEWEWVRVTVEDYRDLGDQVLAQGHFEARGHAVAVNLHVPAAWLAEMQAGKILRVQAYTRIADAFDAVGLQE